MAYNPNDCVELPVGAPEDSDEASACKRHAPAAQRAKMTDYRTWFRERHWPTHAGHDRRRGRADGDEALPCHRFRNARGRTSLLAQDDRISLALDRLVAAYPEVLAGHDAKVLHWRDGTVMPVSGGGDSETLPELLRHAAIVDQFRHPVSARPARTAPARRCRSGPLRNTPSSRRCTATAKKVRCRRALSP